MQKTSDVTTPQSGAVELFRQQFERWRRGLVRQLADIDDGIAALEGGSGDAQLLVRREGADIGTRPAINLHEGTGITLTVTDDSTNNEVDITVNSVISTYTDEQAQDAVGTILVDSARVDFTYSDPTPSITADIVAASIGTTQLTDNGVTFAKMQNIGPQTLIGNEAGTDDPEAIGVGSGLLITGGDLEVDVNTIGGFGEAVDDRVGTLVVEGHGIDVTYNDGANTLTIDVDETELDLTFNDIDPYVIRDFDLTTESTNDWNAGGDGNYSMGGLTWAIVNTGVADTLGLVNGTGLRFNASGGSTTAMTSSTNTATYLRILATTLIPSFSPWHTFLFEIHASSVTFGTTGDSLKFGIWQDTASTDRMLAGGRRNASGAQQTFSANDLSENGFAYTHTNFGVKVNDLGVSTYSGTYSGGFVYTAGGGHFSATDSAPAAMDPTAAYFFIAFPANTAGNADCTLARLRIRRIG